jgi:hypothetical protein
MDTGWTQDPDVSCPDRTLLIRSKSLWRIVIGTCRYLDEPTDGFWFLSVPGIRLHLTGKW